MITTKLDEAVRATRSKGAEGIDAVTAALAETRPVAGLRPLTDRPRLVLELDRQVRARPPLTDRAPVGAGPLVLASCSRDGRIRERAVALILTDPAPELMPFLVARTADRVPQVRDRARAGLVRILEESPVAYTAAMVGTALLLTRRSRGTFPQRQLLAALVGEPAGEAVAGLLRSPAPATRRFALRVAALRAAEPNGRADPGRLRVADLVRSSLTDTDAGVRSHAAEWAAREALWTGQTQVLDRLASSRHHHVRVLALTGMLRQGRVADVADHLDDPAPLVRALARDAARRTGRDPLAHYRNRAAEEPPPLASLDGLAEIGSRADATRLTALLDHPADAVRARALRGLRLLDAVRVDHVVPLLRDRSTVVIREAVHALRPHAAELPAGLAHELLADPRRVAVRRAGYRLLCEPDPSARLATAIAVCADPDPWLAARACAEVSAAGPAPVSAPGRTGRP